MDSLQRSKEVQSHLASKLRALVVEDQKQVVISETEWDSGFSEH